MRLTESVEHHRAAVQRRTVAVLSAAQALGGLGVAIGVAVGGLIAAEIAGTDSVAGLAQTFGVLGAAVAALPLARLTERHGRRTSLVVGMLTGAVGAAVVVVASGWRSMPLLFGGLLLFGAATAAGLQARYGATDLAEPRHTARALSTVVWATTIGSALGPNLAEPAGRVGTMLGLSPLTGPFLVAALGFGCAAGILFGLLRPDPLRRARLDAVEDDVAPARKTTLIQTLRAITTRPRALIGLIAVASCHLAMVSVMVMTPVRMHHGDVSLTLIGLVVSVHIVGMYGLSPLTGWLADRIGRVPVIVGAVLLMAIAAVVSGLAPAHGTAQLGIGLFLLGLGWSGGLVAGSALLSESVPERNRTAAQGVSDLVMNGSAAVGGALAGVVVAQLSYRGLTFGTALLMLGIVAYSLVNGRSAPQRQPRAPLR